MIRQSKFEEIISNAIAKLRASLNPQELSSFESQISTSSSIQTLFPKRSKS